jgi:trk system potassium uptake protein TrkH
LINFRLIFFIIGILLATLAITMLIPTAVDLIEGHADWKAFFSAATITLFVGGALILSAWTGERRFRVREAFALTTLSWIIVAAFGALPFVFSGLKLHYADAYFETMSGLTTTGSTVITGLDELPPGILLWRGLLQGLGGIGIIAMAIAILPMLRIGGMQLFLVESSDKSEKVMPRAAQIAGGILAVYLTLAALCALAFWLLGMTGLEAIVHALTALSTGGFSTSDQSFARFDSPAMEAVAVLFMLLGGMTFTLFLRVREGDLKALATDSQTRTYLLIAAVFSLGLALWHWLINGASPLQALRHSVFNVVSIMTTTGFVSTDYSTWGSLPIVAFFMLTFVGGCSGSTAGAIKVFRFQVLAAIAHAQIRHTLSPNGVFVPKFNRRRITEGVMQSVLTFFFLYIMSFAGLSVGLGLTGLDLVTATSGAATALGNVGPGLGPVIGPVGHFGTLPDAAKWLLSLGMLLGRLELLTVLVMLAPAFWRT